MSDCWCFNQRVVYNQKRRNEELVSSDVDVSPGSQTSPIRNLTFMERSHYLKKKSKLVNPNLYNTNQEVEKRRLFSDMHRSKHKQVLHRGSLVLDPRNLRVKIPETDVHNKPIRNTFRSRQTGRAEESDRKKRFPRRSAEKKKNHRYSKKSAKIYPSLAPRSKGTIDNSSLASCTVSEYSSR